MHRAGQGRHVGVTFLELEGDFSRRQFTRAVARFATLHPLLGARLQRGFLGSVPSWIAGGPVEIEVAAHPEGADVNALAESLLIGNWDGFVRFDYLPTKSRTLVLMSWSHLLFDARGVELALAEIARLAAPDNRETAVRESWGVYSSPAPGLLEKLSAARPFIDRYYKLKNADTFSLAPPPAVPGEPRYRLLHFTPVETAEITKRAHRVTAGIFLMPYFLAVSMRAHAAVLESRGINSGSLQCAIAAQGRKRGAVDPVFQNQVSQLFFVLELDEMKSLKVAAAVLQQQFAETTKMKVDAAFLAMINWMRRLPLNTYRRFLQRMASGNITSLYHAHTGAFLPRTSVFCGAHILNGWHVPSVSQPPGTGAFFSERNGLLTMSFSWREGAVTVSEVDLIFAQTRADLLGAAL